MVSVRKKESVWTCFWCNDCDVTGFSTGIFSPLHCITRITTIQNATSLYSGYWLDFYLTASSLFHSFHSPVLLLLSAAAFSSSLRVPVLTTHMFAFANVDICCYVTGSINAIKHHTQSQHYNNRMDFVTMELRTKCKRAAYKWCKYLECTSTMWSGQGKTWEVLDVDTNYIFERIISLQHANLFLSLGIVFDFSTHENFTFNVLDTHKHKSRKFLITLYTNQDRCPSHLDSLPESDLTEY